MVDFILVTFILAVFAAGIWVGATYGGLQTLWSKAKAKLRNELDDKKDN